MAGRLARRRDHHSGSSSVNSSTRGTRRTVQLSSLLTVAPLPRSAEPPAARLAALLETDELTLPAPGGGDTVGRWAALARWGRTDLPLARLAEGHTDAVAILHELGGRPHRHALYGVWAARPGGAGAELSGGAGVRRLTGTVRFCSGARDLDRALVVAGGPDGMRLVDLPLDQPGVRPVEESWAAPGMRASDTLDVVFDGVAVPDEALVGPPGRLPVPPGLLVGRRGSGGGVARRRGRGARRRAAAGGRRPAPPRARGCAARRAAGRRRAARAHRRDDRRRPDGRAPHGGVDRPGRGRARVPLRAGPGAARRGRRGPAGSATLGARLADLQVFIRQHHGERDLAALGAAVTEVP